MARALVSGVAVFDELRQGVKDIEFLADPTAGELRIGTSESMAADPVVAVIDRLSRQYPRISVHLVMGYMDGLCQELIERKIDLVIIRIAKPIFDRQLVVEELFDDPYVVAAGAQNPWTRRRRVQLAELVNEPWVLLPFDSPAGAIMAQAFRAGGVEPPQATVFKWVLLGQGRECYHINGFEICVVHGSKIDQRMAAPGHSRRVGVDGKSAYAQKPDILGTGFIRREVPYPDSCSAANEVPGLQ